MAVKNFCNGAKSERIRSMDSRIRIYHGFTFDVKAYQSQVSQPVPTLSQDNRYASQVSQVNAPKTWLYIKERFGTQEIFGTLNPVQNGITPFSGYIGTAIDPKNTLGTDSGQVGTDSPPLWMHSDFHIKPEAVGAAKSDKNDVNATSGGGGGGVVVMEGSATPPQTMGPNPRRDALSPTKSICAKCGANLTGHSSIEKNGKTYCAKPGCGYPARGKAEAST
jgi:hypothetical protein